MGLAQQATGRDDLRKRICDMLIANIPKQGVRSDSPKFVTMTGLTQKYLTDAWAKLPPHSKDPGPTSCNSFAGWVAQQIGFPQKSVISTGHLNLSGVDREVPGSWIMANTGEAISYNLHPLPGDFFCVSRPGQEFAHVGIVVDIDPTTLTWHWVAGGQGGRKVGYDWIKWGPWMPDSSRTFTQARPKVPGWVDVAYYFFPKG